MAAPLERFSRLAVREIDGGSHQAISTSTSVVPSSISVESSAHHTGDADHPVVAVGDDPVAGGQAAMHAVEGGDCLAAAGPAHPYPGTAHPAQVKRMAGLAQLEHHVVGDVDDAVDGTLAQRDQPLAIHAGDGPEGVLRSTRPTKRPHSVGSTITTSTASETSGP